MKPHLGVCLSETLEWEAHIIKITSKVNSTLGFFWRNLKACPPNLRETAYFSLVRSSLKYSSTVWDPFRQKDIDKLEKILRSAARFVTQNYKQTASGKSLIQNLGWTDLKTRRKNLRLVSMFKILNELVKIPINDRLIPNRQKNTFWAQSRPINILELTPHWDKKKFVIKLSLIGILSWQMPYRIKNCGSVQESAG